jgi:repressor LexA
MTQANSTSDKIYVFIEAYIAANSWPPSVREIAEGCYVSISTVSYHLRILKAQGRIRRDTKKARSIRPIIVSEEK